MSGIYEIGSVEVVDRDGENPEICFGETTMVFGGGGPCACRLPYLVTGKAYKTGLVSVLKFEVYDKGLFGGVKKYLRDEIGVNVFVDDNTVFKKDGKKVTIEWTGKRCLCESENKSTLTPDDYEKLKKLAKTLCAK